MSAPVTREHREYAARAYLPNSWFKGPAAAWVESGNDVHGIMRIEIIIAQAAEERAYIEFNDAFGSMPTAQLIEISRQAVAN